MNVGDRVRLLHSSEEGIISKIVDERFVEVEIEDGFAIPVKRSEVVRIAQEETFQFGNTLQKPEIPNPDLGKPSVKKKTGRSTQPELPFAQAGIYVAFIPQGDRALEMHLINNTDFHLPYTLGLEVGMRQEGLHAGVLAKKTAKKVHSLRDRQTHTWGVFIFQFLYFHEQPRAYQEPAVYRQRFRPALFEQDPQAVPVLDQKGFALQLDQDQNPRPEKKETPKLDPEKLKESMFEPKEPVLVSKAPVQLKAPKLEVDLHIEELSPDHNRLNSAEIIELQIKTFEQNLESAIALGMIEITFIHGVGNGTLRQEIHRRLAGHPDIQFFQDAQKERFGYGATLVRFK